MNTGFYKDLDTNFEQALEMSEKDFSHLELIEMLKTGNINYVNNKNCKKITKKG